MPAPIPLTLVGSTGLTGSAALSALLTSPTAFAITTLTRRPAPAAPSSTANAATRYTNRVVDLAGVFLDGDKEAGAVGAVGAPGGVYVSCLGTTMAQAGGVEAARRIDYELNREIALKARAEGAETMVLVSSRGADASSWMPYTKTKGLLEDAVKSMGFTNTVILRPGILLYDGSREDARTSESIAVSLVKGIRAVGIPISYLGVDADDVGAAIAQLAAHPPAGLNVLYDADIVKHAKAFRASQKQ